MSHNAPDPTLDPAPAAPSGDLLQDVLAEGLRVYGTPDAGLPKHLAAIVRREYPAVDLVNQVQGWWSKMIAALDAQDGVARDAESRAELEGWHGKTAAFTTGVGSDGESTPESRRG